MAANDVGYPAEEQSAWQGQLPQCAHTLRWKMVRPRAVWSSAGRRCRLAPPTSLFVRGLAELSGRFSATARNPQQAIAYCRRSLAESTDMPNVRTLRLLLALCGVYYGEANTDEIVTVAATYLHANAAEFVPSASAGRILRPDGAIIIATNWNRPRPTSALAAMRRKIHVGTLMDGYTDLS
ncbi:MAG: hypothetical protein R3A10_12515 [Caldilineaceae bacterium]